ncbi:hypothetical protein HJG60_010347 [Phyllostomus discolor]|uniref:Uncharacterized protein n=1 Tax=Phyllostomus discolor TaxID=89673 RepID=A0A834B1Q9_9CHIR|nr:hypothetical protein HJG60_010347 [Phyllostomus discolor]
MHLHAERHPHVCVYTCTIRVYQSMHMCTYNTHSMQVCKCLYKRTHVCDYVNAHRHLHTHTEHTPPAPHACEDTGSQLSEVTTQGSQRRQALPRDARSSETLLPVTGLSLIPPEKQPSCPQRISLCTVGRLTMGCVSWRCMCHKGSMSLGGTMGRCVHHGSCAP